jgi:hypothetical protein
MSAAGLGVNQSVWVALLLEKHNIKGMNLSDSFYFEDKRV